MSNPMMQAMQQLQLMQEKMAEAQAALEQKRITRSGGDGLVQVTVSGLGKIIGITISPEAMTAEDKDTLEDLLITTINHAVDEAKEIANQDIGDATNGLMPNIPGLDLPI
ncbi:MAG: YbaB/EbfC family nucleoid-associated protein [Chlorobi bacterium]|nr:YbaB/EbfC family nucleoid-associated protein [Chlorobiota bacterium]